MTLISPNEQAAQMGARAKTLRLLKGWTRSTLEDRSGVKASSLKRFENTGKGSLDLILKVAHALGRLEEFAQLFQPPPVQSIAELEKRATRPRRQRGRK